MDKVNIVGVNVCNITLDEGKSVVADYLEQDNLKTIFTPNSEMLMTAIKEPKFCEILNQGDLVIPDGIGVVIASKFYKNPLKERVAGYDLMCKMIELANEKSSSVYILGAKLGVAEMAKNNILENYPNILFKGIRDGYFSDDDTAEIVKEISDSKADMLFVGLGAPRQEKWIFNNKENLNVKVAIGVGGSIDVFAKVAKRAPEIYQKLGLEWFYRLMKQPSRFFRMLQLPKFVCVAFYDAMFAKK